MSGPLYGCVEAGGTKFVASVAHDHLSELASTRIPTTAPSATIGAVIEFFREVSAKHGRLSAIGIASFGPLDVDRSSPGWGRITRTPKPSWTNTDLVTPFKNAFGVPVGLDTDVNGALLAESLWGAARGLDIASYVTVGTGVGGGAIVAGHLLHGSRHPEMGHLLVRRHPADRDFNGVCRFHGDCLEGLASGPAIKARWGVSLSELPPEGANHRIIAYYLAQLVVAQQALLSPRRIILGGGVMATPGLLAKVAVEASVLSKSYFGDVDYKSLVVPPQLGDRSGILGALALARKERR